MLQRLDGVPFATGRVRYLGQLPEREAATAMIHVKVEPDELGAPILALLDTGAAWSVLATDIAEDLNLLDGAGEAATLQTRLGTCRGRLERVPIVLMADEGESLQVEATVFVSREWPDGTVIGYNGLLERVRFAVDPDPEEMFFYFGAW